LTGGDITVDRENYRKLNSMLETSQKASGLEKVRGQADYKLTFKKKE